MRIRSVIPAAVIAAALTVSGCSGGLGKSTSTSRSQSKATSSSTAAAAKPDTYYGESASAIATLIHGCTSVAPVSIGAHGKASGVTSAATCTIGGRKVFVDSWRSVEDMAGIDEVIKADKMETYYASGVGWSVIPGENQTLQRQLISDAGWLFKQALNGTTGTSSGDVPGQKTTATAVVAALNGYIVHIRK